MSIEKEHIQQLIMEGKTEAALKAFLKGAEEGGQTDLYNEVILLMARNTTNEKNNLMGLIEMSGYNMIRAQVNNAILLLLNNFESLNKGVDSPVNNGGVVNKNIITGDNNIIIGGEITGSNINVGTNGNPNLSQNGKNTPDTNLKQKAIEHIENGDFVEAFELLDGVEVGTKKMQYHRFKDEYMAGLNGVNLMDFAKRLKFFVNQLK